jgi:hypothetical protein
MGIGDVRAERVCHLLILQKERFANHGEDGKAGDQRSDVGGRKTDVRGRRAEIRGRANINT